VNSFWKQASKNIPLAVRANKNVSLESFQVYTAAEPPVAFILWGAIKACLGMIKGRQALPILPRQPQRAAVWHTD